VAICRVRDKLAGVHAKPLLLDGQVYFGAFDGFVHCVDARSGNPRREARCADCCVSCATSAPAGDELNVSSATDAGGGVIAALSAETAQIIWRLETPSPIESSPSLDLNRSRLIAGTDDGVVYAFDASSGEEAWRFSTVGAVKGTAAIDRYSRCFVGSEDGFFYAIDGNSGALIWKRKISNSLHTQPLLCGDMRVGRGFETCRRSWG
jgi:outer membrane protein assembly factor BamB